MSEGLLDFMGHDPQRLQLTATLGEATAKWLRHRYPTNTAKLVARDTATDPRTAENIVNGHLSATTLTRLIRAYGWSYLAAVGAATVGETYEEAINRELEEIADERRRLDEMEAGLRGRWAGLRARRSVDGGGLRLVHPGDDDAAGEDRRAG